MKSTPLTNITTMKTPYEIYQEMEGEFDEKFRPIDFCNEGNDKMYYVEETRKDIKSHNRNSLIAVLKALEGQIPDIRNYGGIMLSDLRKREVTQIINRERIHFRSLITDLIANLEK